MSSGRNKSPTRAQLSSRLAYEKKVPAFLQKLQNKINGVGNDDDDDEPERYYEGRRYDEDEFEIIDDGSGRPPIPRRPRSRERERPPIPERPADDPGSADEDDYEKDELPQVVVLKQGKHLTEREAENVRRKEKGLPPLPEAKDDDDEQNNNSIKSTKKTKDPTHSLSFSSSSKTSTGSKSKSSSNFKRKILGDPGDVDDRLAAAESEPTSSSKKARTTGNKNSTKDGKDGKKKAKKNSKTLLSFDDNA